MSRNSCPTCSSSKKKKYLDRSEVCLALQIPMDAGINNYEVFAHEAIIVKPKIKFFSYLKWFMQTEITISFYSTVMKSNVAARKVQDCRPFLTSQLSIWKSSHLVWGVRYFNVERDWFTSGWRIFDFPQTASAMDDAVQAEVANGQHGISPRCL